MKKTALAALAALVSLAAIWIPSPASGSGLDSSFGPTRNLWIDRDVLRSVPTSGAPWERLSEDALGSWGSANISDQESDHDVLTFAGALYAVRKNDVSMRNRVVDAIEDAIGTEQGGRTLALGRNLTGYVLAADLIGYDSSLFRNWLAGVRSVELDGRTLISTNAERPNNWGAHAGAARIATDLFLGDTADLEQAVRVFHGFLGDRSAWNNFRFGDGDWQANPSAPVPINPAGATKNGIDVDGAIVDDIRRCECPVSSPAPKENYQWEGMQGIVTQATLLYAAGYTDIWERSDAAIRRAVTFLYEEADFPAEGDDTFVLFLIDAALGTNYAAGQRANMGKSMAYTDVTHPNGSTASTQSTFIAAPTPRTTGTMRYVPLPPTRLFDTRTSAQPSGRLDARDTIDVQVTGRAGVPSSNVGAVVLNVTATNTARPGYVAVWPTGDGRPPTSNLNITSPGETVPNLVAVPVGAGGKVSFYSLESLDLLADVSGYFVEDSDARGGRFVPVAPTRAFDTRDRGAPVGANSSISVQFAGGQGIPSSGASVAVINLTAVGVGGPGFVTAYPHGIDRPVASSLNLLGPGDVRSNLVFAPIGADGRIDFYSLTSTHLIGDVIGYFTDASASRSTTGMFVATNSMRHVDTRVAIPDSSAKWIARRSSSTYQIGGRGNVPGKNVSAVLANLTATQAAGPGYLTIWAAGAGRPSTSSVNVTAPGATRSNAVIARLGSDRAVTLYSHEGVHAIVDVFGYFVD